MQETLFDIPLVLHANVDPPIVMENQDQEPLQEQVAGDELLPPFFIVSSSAKEGNRKLDAKMFPAFRQVVGTYGFQCEYYHDKVFAATASGYVINMYAITCSI